MRHPRMNHHPFAARLCRKITLVTDPDNFLVEPEGKQHFRSRWQKRNNAHSLTLSQKFAPYRISELLARPRGPVLVAQAFLPVPRDAGAAKTEPVINRWRR